MTVLSIRLLLHICISVTWNSITDVNGSGIGIGYQVAMTGSSSLESSSCPPGFIQEGVTGMCNCSVGTSSGYYGIGKCNMDLQQAHVDHNYWIGYDSGKKESEDTLLSGYCPWGFCSPQHGYLLPPTASRSLLEEAICAPNRTGTLCGKCKTNHSARYHSLMLTCEPNEYCEWGWVFYIVSEIIPVTLIFLIIIFCNISITSGLANSFIFYCQTVKMLHIRADRLIKASLAANYLEKAYQFIFFFLNLDPFVLDEISYCMKENTNAIDIFSFSNITVVYSFFLIIAVVLVRSKCNFRLFSCKYLLNQRSMKKAVQGNMIHGLTTFLLLFSARCAHNSVLILGYINVYGKGYQKRKSVVRYDGDIDWMSVKHLPYAIPAIILLIVMSIPPITLIIYPLHYKILSLLNIADSKVTRCLFDPLERLKPFLDSFQGCLKDNFRFFSGLYLIYRIVISFIMASLKPTDADFSVSVMLTLLLILHSSARPYLKKLHNIVDVLLLGNLLLINMITEYNISKTKSFDPDAEVSLAVSITSWIQLLLIFTPLICLLVPLKKVISKLRRKYGASRGIEISESTKYGTFSDQYR